MCTWSLQGFAALAVVALLCAEGATWDPGQVDESSCSQSHGAGGACVGTEAELGDALLAKTAVLNRVKLEILEPTPEVPAGPVMITERVVGGSVPKDDGPTAPRPPFPAARARFPLADLAELLGETRAFGAAAAEAEAAARARGDARTALVSKRAVEAAANEAEFFTNRSLYLYNPSLVEMPLPWRRTKERWLGVFRHQALSAWYMPNWYASSIVLAVLDEDLRLVRPLRVLRSRDFFEETFDCQWQQLNNSFFGPEDARLFTEQHANGSETVSLFFTARSLGRQPNQPCEVSGGQRMYTAVLGEDLKPVSVGKIRVQGEESTHHHAQPPVLVDFPAGEIAPISGRLGAVEKNWSPFMYQAPSASAPQVMLEYHVQPHVVMDFDSSGRRAGGEGLWRSHSVALGAWLQRQESAIGLKLDLHGGVGPILMDEQAGQPPVYLSVLHTRDNSKDWVYRSYFYTFEARPPFTILAVGEKALPAKVQMCTWGSQVAFPTNLLRVEGRDGPEFWVLYGSGDYEAHRLVFSWSELQAFLPPLPSAGIPASGSTYRGDPFIMTDGRDQASARPEVVLTAADTKHLEEEIATWTQKLVGDQAQHPSNRTAEIRRRMQLAAASEMDFLQKKRGFDKLYNPSMLELPAGWRRSGERWLAVFREKVESAASTAEVDAQWYSFSLVLAILDDDMRPTRPVTKLRSEDLFEHGGFDCQLAETDTAYFGPADARLFLNPGEKERASEILLFFTARAMAAEPNTPCPAHGGQRMYVARVESNLTTDWAAPLLIPGEEEPQDGFVSTSSQDAGVALHQGDVAEVGPLRSVEKNWAPFSYRAPTVGNASLGEGQRTRRAAQILVEYTVEPHVIMDFEESSHRVGGKHVWKTRSSVVETWLARRNAQYSETYAVASASDIHGGVGALLVEAYAGRPKVFLSVLHARFTDKSGKETYHSYMYTFEAAPPFRILGVAEKELPLVKKPCRWGAEVAFPMSLTRAEGTSGEEFQLLYGSGDGEAHRLPLTELGSFLPAKHDLVPGQPGLTLVMMSHSHKRFQDLGDILRHYRAMNPGLLEEIILIWNDPQDPGAVEELRLLNNDEGVPLQVIAAEANSMNNRFAVWEVVSTEGVIIQDDDMWVDEADLSCLADVWRAEPERLVGASNERVHIKHDATGQLLEMCPECVQEFHLDQKGNKVFTNDTSCKFWGEEYSILLPHPWVLSKKYLRLYTENHEGTKLVDSMLNCDDIYLNAVVSNYTRAPPVAVNVPVHRYPTWNDNSAMWASDNEWAEHRTQCLEEVNSYYVDEPMSPDTDTVFRMASRSLTCPAKVAPPVAA